jgi:hypothetical protein
MKFTGVVILLLINILLLQSQTSIPEISLESPIRFEVEVNTAYPDYISTPVLEKDWGVLILPSQYSVNGKPVPLVIGCHGGGGTVNSSGSQMETYEMYMYFIYQGYAVLDMAGMPESFSKRKKIDHNRTVGSYIALRSYEEGYKFAIKNYNIDSTGCYVTGSSNGGLIASIIALHSRVIPVRAQGGMSPLLSIKENAWNLGLGANSGGEFYKLQNRANIIRIFQMKDVRNITELLNANYEKEKVGDYDPLEYVRTKITKINQYPCPVKFWHPVNDTLVDLNYTKEYINIVRESGGYAELEEMPDGIHTPEYFGPNLAQFKYSGRKWNLKQSVYELGEWFRTFSKVDSGNNEMKEKLSGFVYPTNSKDHIFINVIGEYSEDIEIYNISGQLILKVDNIIQNQKIDVSTLVKGSYIIKLKNKNVFSRFNKI